MAKETSNNQSAPVSSATDNKLAAIKEIIFGQEQAELKHDLDELKALVEQENIALRNELSAVNQKLEASLKSFSSDLSKKLESQQKHTDKEIARIDRQKTNRKALGKMLVNIGEKLMKED